MFFTDDFTLADLKTRTYNFEDCPGRYREWRYFRSYTVNSEGEPCSLSTTEPNRFVVEFKHGDFIATGVIQECLNNTNNQPIYGYTLDGKTTYNDTDTVAMEVIYTGNARSAKDSKELVEKDKQWREDKAVHHALWTFANKSRHLFSLFIRGYAEDKELPDAWVHRMHTSAGLEQFSPKHFSSED